MDPMLIAIGVIFLVLILGHIGGQVFQYMMRKEMKEIAWDSLRIQDFQEFNKRFLKKGAIRIIDGDKRTISHSS